MLVGRAEPHWAAGHRVSIPKQALPYHIILLSRHTPLASGVDDMLNRLRSVGSTRQSRNKAQQQRAKESDAVGQEKAEGKGLSRILDRRYAVYEAAGRSETTR